jgi:hypothetical protein
MTLDLKALEREANRHFGASGVLSNAVVNPRQLLGLIERARLADKLAEALRSCNIVNPVLMPSNEQTERIWKAMVEVRPRERRYFGDTLTGAQFKAVRDAIAAYDDAIKQGAL